MRRPADITRDYNRGLIAPVRWAHAGVRRVRPVFGPGWAWASAPKRRTWARPLFVGVLALPLLLLDPAIARWMGGVRLGGDVRRELEALGQYGQLTSSLVIALVVWVMDPPRRRRLLDWGAAAAITGLVVTGLKMLVGRPRPLMHEAWTFLGPAGGRPMGPGEGVVLPYEFWRDGVEKLWSMPSSHTAYAVVASAFLAIIYPRLTPIVATLAVLVGVSRVAFGAHYASDVVIGGCVGLAIAGTAVRRGWGVRALDWVWVRFVDRQATPAWDGGR